MIVKGFDQTFFPLFWVSAVVELIIVPERCPKCGFKSVKATNVFGISRCPRCNVFLKEKTDWSKL